MRNRNTLEFIGIWEELHNPGFWFTAEQLNGDTVINSLNYKKIFENSLYAGALREDNKIIYFIPGNSLTEYLLYNFNLTVGDSIINPFTIS